MFYLSRPVHALNERVTYYPHLKYCTCLHINILFKLVFGKHESSSHPTLVSFRAPLTLTSISMRHREIGLGGVCILCRSRSAHLYCSTYAQMHSTVQGQIAGNGNLVLTCFRLQYIVDDISVACERICFLVLMWWLQ